MMHAMYDDEANRLRVDGVSYDYESKILSIAIYGNVGDWFGTYKARFIELMDYAARYREEYNEVQLVLSTDGGYLADALVIYNTLKASGIPITCYLVGYVMSAGTVIACAADRVIATRSAVYMIHNAGIVLKESARLERAELQRQVGQLEAFDKTMAAIYSQKTGMTQEDILNLMSQEKYMTSEQALELGFVDEIIDAIPSLYYPPPVVVETNSNNEIGVITASGDVVKATAMTSKDYLPTTPSKTAPMKLFNDLKASLMSAFTKIEAIEKDQNLVTASGSPSTEPTSGLNSIAANITARLESVEGLIESNIQSAVEARVTAMVSAWDTQREKAIADQKQQIETLNAQITANASKYQTEVDALKAEIASIKTAPAVTASGAGNSAPPVPPAANKVSDDAASQFLKNLGVQPL